MTKRSVGSATTAKLNQLGLDLAAAEKAKKTAEADIVRIKGEIADIAATYALPVKESKSEYLPIDGGPTIRVTRAAAPTQKILTAELRHLIRDHLDEITANQVFLDVVILPKTCDIDIDYWARYVDDETVLDSMLVKALEPAKEAPKPNVQLTHRKDF